MTNPPLYVLGDIHANIFDLLRIIIYCHPPPESQFVFLGDYVDRGEFSVEVATLLFALYLTYPDRITILRGNHEFLSVNEGYGFLDEIHSQYSTDTLYRKINEVFSWLPLWGNIGNKYFCVHGGLSPTLHSLDQIQDLKRPIVDYELNQIISDMMWSDPSGLTSEFDRNNRGCGLTFGAKAADNFLSQTGLSAIFRGHQCVQLGVQKAFNGKIFTVFSCSMYERTDTNRAGLLFISHEGDIKIFSLPPLEIPFRANTSLSQYGADGKPLSLNRHGLMSRNTFLADNTLFMRSVSVPRKLGFPRTRKTKSKDHGIAKLPPLL